MWSVTERITFSVPDELAEDINGQLSYGDNRSEWLRDAVREKLARDAESDSPQNAGDKQQTDQQRTRADVSQLDLPGSVDPAAAADAVAAVVDELRERGTATKGELVRAVMPSHDLGYDAEAAVKKVETSGERYRGAWWRRVVKPALEQDERVEKPSGGRSKWRWTG